MEDERSYLLMVGRIVAIIISVILGVAIISGCYTPKKAYRQVAKADFYHPQVVQEFCNDITIDSIIKGDTVVITTPGKQVDCDTVTIYTTINGKGKIFDCPPSETKTVTDTIYIEDKDKLNAKIHELTICTEAKNKAEGAKKTLTRNFTISAILNLLLACCCGLLLRLKKFL